MRRRNMSLMNDLQKLVADIIYEADWEHRGDNFYMIDEEETVEAIIKAVRSLKQTMRNEK